MNDINNQSFSNGNIGIFGNNSQRNTLNNSSNQYPYSNNIGLNNYENSMGNRMNGFQNGNYFQSQNQGNQFLKGRPVSSREQASAAQIDLNGSLWVFTDVGNERIYTKQILPDGTSKFRVYVYSKEESQSNGYSAEFVTRTQFDKTLQTLMGVIQNINNNLESAGSKEKTPPTGLQNI